MKTYPTYKDNGIEFIGKIPEHWNLYKLKRLIQEGLMYGANESAEVEDTNLPRYIRITDFDEAGHLRNNTFKSLPYELAKGYFLKEGDILFARSGATVGKTFQFKNYDGEACFAGYLIKATPDTNKILSDFLYLFTKSNSYEHWKNSIFIQATIQNIGANKYQYLEIPLPPLPEQQAIADFLNRKTAQIDDLIAKKQRQIDLLHEQRTALINQAVTKGLNPDALMKDSGVAWLGEIPNHWMMTTVRYFYDVKLGRMLDSNKQNGNGLVKSYLRAANIHWNKILLDGVGVNEMEFSESQLERYVLQSGDLLVTEGGVTVGRSAIWNGELAECYYQNSLNRARSINNISTKWLYYWMYFVTNNGFIDILADKATFGHLTNEKLKALPIPIPPISEHDEIIEKLESYEPKMEFQIGLIERQIAYLQEYRTALISAAVTGKIDVREEGTVHE